MGSTAPPVPGLDRSLRDDLAVGARTPRFRSALARQAVVLAGVFTLGWPAHEVAVFYLLEVWLFLTFRGTAEVSLDPRYGAWPAQPWKRAGEVLLQLLVCASFMACIVGFFGGFAMIPFPDVPWGSFWRDARRDPYFLGAFALLAGTIAYDTALFVRRMIAGRTSGEVAGDEDAKRLALARLLILVIATFVLGLTVRAGLGPKALAVAIAGAVLYVEAVPARAASLFDAQRHPWNR